MKAKKGRKPIDWTDPTAFRRATKADYEALPVFIPWEVNIECASVVLVPDPKRVKHDSGYMMFSVVAFDEKNHLLGRLGGSSDVVHIEGIGGYRAEPRPPNGFSPAVVPTRSWNLDCLPCGLWRMWVDNRRIIIGARLSSLEIYSRAKEKKDEKKQE